MCSKESPEGSVKRPNVVWIVLDDVGFADLGCYGSEIDTPHINWLADRGLRYTNFHTTAMCSPTRASLLTGRQHHAVGMGIIAEWSTPHPGYSGRITGRAATLAEVLKQEGYGTFAAGKWHVMPQSDARPAGPFRDWPLQRGFDRWYGFHGALADQWCPELFEDNHTIDTPREPDYHLSDDLVDRSIGFIRDHWVSSPSQPFFLYLAFGATHWPHQVPSNYVDKYRGRYDKGWDAVRHERLERQREMGIVPPDTRLAPRNKGVAPWDELDDERKRLFARMQEVYAAFVEHTDAQFGRLIEYLEHLGQLDNTLVVLISDNGASAEGGMDGALNARKALVYESEDFWDKLRAIDDLGSDRTYNHYPWGWAQASNTPLKWYKKDVYGGGVRGPLIVHWPRLITDSGGLRRQYHHVVDITPTVLELLDVAAPASYKGIEQMPMQGVSMAYSIDDAEASTRKTSQYFEMLGNRSLWKGGWKAVTHHERGTPFEEDIWELYNLDDDFSESENLAAMQPDVLHDLIADWWREAEKNNVLPLDDREYERVAASIAVGTRTRTILLPGMARLDRYHVPDITDSSYRIIAEVEIPPGGAEGVLLSIGSRFGGLAFYVQYNYLVFEYVYDSTTRWVITSESPLPSGYRQLKLIFRRTGRRSGIATLDVDGRAVGSSEIRKTWPVAGLAGGLHCGRDGASPVSDAYPLPFAFTGSLHQVIVDLQQDGAPDLEAEKRRALGEE